MEEHFFIKSVSIDGVKNHPPIIDEQFEDVKTMVTKVMKLKLVMTLKLYAPCHVNKGYKGKHIM